MSENEIELRPVKDRVPDLRGGKKLLTTKQMKFLRVFGEALDKDDAARAAGYNDASTAMESEVIVAEMEKIQEAWFHENRMNSKFASGEHMRLMEKFEKEYDSTGAKLRPQVASVLAKMSETSLKASGKMDQNADQARTQVLVQLNIGGDKAEADVSQGGITIKIGEG